MSKERYLKFLEDVCHAVVEAEPEIISVAMLDAEGTTVTMYFPNDTGAEDKAFLSAVIQQDGMMDRIANNPEWLRNVLDTAEQGEIDEQ